MTLTASYSPTNISISKENGNTLFNYGLLKGKLCPTCSYPLSFGLCKRKKYHSSNIRRISAIGYYYPSERKTTDHLSKSVRNLKKHIGKAEPLGKAIASIIKNRDTDFLDSDIIIPVPQHPTELKKDEDSGIMFDQAVELGRVVSREISRHLLLDILIKTRPSKDDKKDSREDLQGTYTCKNEKLSGKRVILVDDVMTRGYHLDACAEEIKKSGASMINAFVCGITHLR